MCRKTITRNKNQCI